MFTIKDRYQMNNKEYAMGILHEQANQHLKQKKYVVRFPCHDVSVELERPEDTYMECPQCHKHYLLTYSANRTKLWSQ